MLSIEFSFHYSYLIKRLVKLVLPVDIHTQLSHVLLTCTSSRLSPGCFRAGRETEIWSRNASLLLLVGLELRAAFKRHHGCFSVVNTMNIHCVRDVIVIIPNKINQVYYCCYNNLNLIAVDYSAWLVTNADGDVLKEVYCSNWFIKFHLQLLRERNTNKRFELCDVGFQATLVSPYHIINSHEFNEQFEWRLAYPVM